MSVYSAHSLDTGRLNPETYRLFDRVEKHYGIRIEYTFPDAQETMDLVREKGMFSFYEDGHQECCRVRKVGIPVFKDHCEALCQVLTTPTVQHIVGIRYGERAGQWIPMECR
jgi:hypothetical protein